MDSAFFRSHSVRAEILPLPETFPEGITPGFFRVTTARMYFPCAQLENGGNKTLSRRCPISNVTVSDVSSGQGTIELP